jgi:hypothetical protein
VSTRYDAELVEKPNIINHIALVLDASVSMTNVARELVKVADAEIKHLARRSQELDQETRVTVYVFGDDVRCVIYDKDVLRLPSIERFYRVDGNTALIAATMKSQRDLGATAQLYGDHAFLTYVLTDGEENVSRFSTVFGGDGQRRYHGTGQSKYTTEQLTQELSRELTDQPDNWTVACLVPNARGVHEAKKFGFPANNIAVWDATSGEGVAEVFGTTIRTATDTFMTNRARGVRGSKTLFTGGADVINTKNVRASTGFTPLGKDTYTLCQATVDLPDQIRPYVETVTGAQYTRGSAYYELTKPEKIQAQKKILVRNRKSGRVYSGDDSRKLLGLPDHEVRVKPEHNPEFQIFVQSTSVNRKLVPGAKLIILK